MCLLLAGAAEAAPQDAGPHAAQPDDGFKVRLGGELKANGRWSEDDRLPLAFPFPPEFVPQGQPNVALQTVSPGGSIELSKALLLVDVEMPRSITAHLKVAFISLYDRNPTSTDQTVNVEEGWVAFGTKKASLEPLPGGASFFALVGKAPKLDRQPFRRLESYGLVSTAFNRFNDLQVQAGGSIGSHVYFMGQVSSGNPIFMRDPNVLAGDNGTDEPPSPDPKLHSGFPILYHAEVEELSNGHEPEWGGAAGVRFLSADFRRGIDAMGFYYRGRLSAQARLRGTFYEVASTCSTAPAGSRCRSTVTAWSATAATSTSASAASRPGARSSTSGSRACRGRASRWRPGGAWRSATSPTRPTSSPRSTRRPRRRLVEDDFQAPRGFVAPSFAWDWDKLDAGLRVTIVKRVDLTLEYSFHDIAASRAIRHDEALATLRVQF
ncbi:MAG: hypothetical protein U0599_05460 [Vicinamibacteria bacterium]